MYHVTWFNGRPGQTVVTLRDALELVNRSYPRADYLPTAGSAVWPAPERLAAAARVLTYSERVNALADALAGATEIQVWSGGRTVASTGRPVALIVAGDGTPSGTAPS